MVEGSRIGSIGIRPPYDAAVEWIGGDRNSFLLFPFNNVKIDKIDVTYMRGGLWSENVFGRQYEDLHIWHRHINNRISDQQFCSHDWYGGGLTALEDIQLSNVFSATIDSKNGTCTDSNGSVHNYPSYLINDFILFGLRQSSDGAALPSTVKILRFTISWGENVIDLIPVRINGEGAMYDINGVGGINSDGSYREDGLYFNRGTGTFIIGPDKNRMFAV